MMKWNRRHEKRLSGIKIVVAVMMNQRISIPKRNHVIMVKRIHYQRNSTVLISEISKYVIDINTPDKFHRLRMLHSVLSTTELLTLIEGRRTEPIMTEENAHGFSNRKILLVPRIEYEDEKSIDSMSSDPIIERVILEEDDAFHYIYDNDRLFSLVYIMFSKILHHNISIQNQKSRNGI